MPVDFKSRPTVNGVNVALLSELAGVHGSYAFTPTSAFERHRVVDSNVLSTSKIVGKILRPNQVEANDYGWAYDFNVVKVANGYFDINVETSVLGESGDTELGNPVGPFSVALDGSGSDLGFGGLTAKRGTSFTYTGWVSGAIVRLAYGNPSFPLVVEIQGVQYNISTDKKTPNEVVLARSDPFSIGSEFTTLNPTTITAYFKKPIYLLGQYFLVVNSLGDAYDNSTQINLVDGLPGTNQTAVLNDPYRWNSITTPPDTASVGMYHKLLAPVASSVELPTLFYKVL